MIIEKVYFGVGSRVAMRLFRKDKIHLADFLADTQVIANPPFKIASFL
ncbi:hypothetical protein K7G42_07925 [Streptococcus parauberis]|uniref:Uncharacterized protein n=1 Tax=Streptococcus parauberis KRS-02083 TaxID=1207545 RepID=A0ABP2SYN0_9STRE|nr:hypothetical protein [Streptococcus parauberis]EMG25566.1 hypothetical protein SPJ1_0977 [Streptococcus parauberis KRS-02083]UWV09806.1 hypothetical protein N2A95_08525 [Streptococcus parauberis]WEM64497.1 hypothetical protein P1T45_07655 [Streptococcus parauberis]WOF46331.1 hypothetical protein K7G42_07925 [Streptococcus parauberis]